MIDWMRVDAHLQDSPKIHRLQILAMRAGNPGIYGVALSMWLAVLGANRCSDAEGRLTDIEADPRYLGRHAMLAGATHEEVDQALDMLHAVRLVEKVADGSLRICGWDDTWRTPKSDAERQRDRRRPSVTEPVTRHVTEGVTRGVTEPVTHVSREVSREVSRLSDRQTVLPQTDRASDSPSSPTPPRKDGPIESTPKPDPQPPEDDPAASPLDAELRALGIASAKHRAKAARHLSEFHDPAPVLRIVLAHCRRYGDGPGLLATVLGDRQQIALVLREAETKADTEDARKAAQDLLARLKLRTMAATAGAAR